MLKTLSLERKNDKYTEPIPLKQRIGLQVFLMGKMIPVDSYGKETFHLHNEIEWADEYAKKVAVIIDNSENYILRELIMEQKYEEASKIIIPLLLNN